MAVIRSLPAPLLKLKDYPQFITWVLDGDQKKPLASTTDPKQWTTLDNALQMLQHSPDSYGLGFVFTESDPFFFLDIDGARNGAGWSPLANEILARFPGAAVETSQSGNGLHIFGCYSEIPPHACKNTKLHLELYHHSRFVALTGTDATGDIWIDYTAALTDVINTYFPPSDSGSADVDLTAGPVPEYTGPPDDMQLIAKMLQSRPSAAAQFGDGASVADLWYGNTDKLAAAYPSPTGAPYDASSADQALCNHLAFWTGKDGQRINRLFKLSALYRPDKWDVHPTYAVTTVTKGISAAKSVYTGGKRDAMAELPGPTVTATDPQDTNTKTGYQLLTVHNQRELFKGCVYIRSHNKIFVPDGDLLTSAQFRADYGGYTFMMDTVNQKTSFNAWEAFTENRGYNFPKAHDICFRPECEPGATINEAGRSMVNIYVPVPTDSKPGDPAPFLNHLAKLLPDPGDQKILLSYMAACVQYPGVKFQWCPLIQGVEGNGKTLFTRCVAQAVGLKYTHLPNAADLGNKFNGWLLGKLFIGVEEINVSDKLEVMDRLKEMVTNEYIEIQAKGTDQVTGDNRANFIMCSNHKNAVRKTANDRRFSIFYTAQQKAAHILRDGLQGNYFPQLYGWLKSEGYAIVNNYLRGYQIPEDLNPATLCQRAPHTSTTNEALSMSMGGVEQEIIARAKEGRRGFAGGWLSSLALNEMLELRRDTKRIPRNRRPELLEDLGYTPHPGLTGGRCNVLIAPEGGKPKLYITADNPAATLTDPAAIVAAYKEAQGYE